MDVIASNADIVGPITVSSKQKRPTSKVREIGRGAALPSPLDRILSRSGGVEGRFQERGLYDPFTYLSKNSIVRCMARPKLCDRL
jgi:hypothetical protein